MRLGNGWARKSRAYILPGKQPVEGRGSAGSREVRGPEHQALYQWQFMTVGLDREVNDDQLLF
jgi:hypothetical protein